MIAARHESPHLSMEPMSALVDKLAAQLQEKGIDPANFSGYVPKAVETLATDRAEAGSLLEHLANRTERYQELGIDTWSLFAFCLLPIAELSKRPCGRDAAFRLSPHRRG